MQKKICKKIWKICKQYAGFFLLLNIACNMQNMQNNMHDMQNMQTSFPICGICTAHFADAVCWGLTLSQWLTGRAATVAQCCASASADSDSAPGPRIRPGRSAGAGGCQSQCRLCRVGWPGPCQCGPGIRIDNRCNSALCQAATPSDYKIAASEKTSNS